MICFKCISDQFEVRRATVSQEFRGENFELNANLCVCKACGWRTLGPGQADDLLKQVVEEWRKRHPLPTSAEIK